MPYSFMESAWRAQSPNRTCTTEAFGFVLRSLSMLKNMADASPVPANMCARSLTDHSGGTRCAFLLFFGSFAAWLDQACDDLLGVRLSSHILVAPHVCTALPVSDDAQKQQFAVDSSGYALTYSLIIELVPFM